MMGTRAAIPSLAMLAMSCASCLAGQSSPASPTPSAETIMTRVAANQDRSEAERAHYVYVQHARTVSRRGGTVMCEEITDYRVTPAGSGSHEELMKVDGRVRDKHRYITYTALLPDDEDDAKGGGTAKDAGDKAKASGKQSGSEGQGAKSSAADSPTKTGDDDDGGISISIGGDSADRQMVENMRKGLMNDKSRDGISARLFPLTSKDQTDYVFELAGRERMNGRDVFHVIFRPKDKQDFGWKGDAYIDTEAYQPVLVTTGMARKIPFAVRTFLGINLPGLGFTVTYAPQPDGVWFPATFSTEFKIEVLFFFRRTIVIDAQNRDFEKTHVTSRIVGGASPVDPDKP